MMRYQTIRDIDLEANAMSNKTKKKLSTVISLIIEFFKFRFVVLFCKFMCQSLRNKLITNTLKMFLDNCVTISLSVQVNFTRFNKNVRSTTRYDRFILMKVPLSYECEVG